MTIDYLGSQSGVGVFCSAYFGTTLITIYVLLDVKKKNLKWTPMMESASSCAQCVAHP